MTKCAVTTCGADSTRSPDITFYHFPRDPEDLKKWVACCGNTAKTFTGKSAVICSQHFLPSDFHRDLQAELLGLSRKRKLKNGIIPSINVHCYLNDNFKFGSNEKLKHTVKLKQCPVPKETCFSLRGTNYNKKRSASSNIARTLQRKKTVSQHDRHNNINIEKKDLQPEKNSEKVVTKNKCHRNSKKKKEESSQSFVNSEIEIKEEKYIIEDELYEETPVPSVVLNNTVHENCSDMSAFVKEEMYDILDTLENEFLGQNKVMQEVKSEIPISKHNETGQTVLTVGKTLGSKTPRVRDRKTSQVKLHTLRTQDNEEYYMFIPENISESSEHEETELNSEIIVKEEMSILEEESRMYEPNRQQGNVENISPNEQDDSQKPVADVLVGKQSEQMSNSKSKLQKDGVSVQDNNIRTAGRENDSKVILLDPSAIQHGFLLPDSVKQPVFFVIPPSYFNISDKGNTAVEPVVEKKSQCKSCGKTFKYRHEMKEESSTHISKECDTNKMQSIGYVSKSPNYCHICVNYKSSERHINLHKKFKKFTCDYCEKYFVCKALLKVHLLKYAYGECKMNFSTFSERILVRCDNCGQFKSQVKEHTCVDKDKELYKYDMCNKNFRSKRTPQNHLHFYKADTPYKCNICGKVLMGNTSLREHNYLVHGIKKYEHFTLKKDFFISKEKHLYTCNECDKHFTGKYSLMCHLYLHSGDGPNKCNICKKVFHGRSNFHRHMDTVHNNYRFYLCDRCGKTYKRSYALIEHMKSTHKTSNYVCTYCGAVSENRFAHSKHLREHKGNAVTSNSRTINRLPTGRRRKIINHLPTSTCGQCGKVLQTNRLSNHMRTHLDSPSKCDICGKIFKNKLILKQHFDTIHSNKEVCQCDICGKNFRYKKLLKEHLVLHAGIRNYLCSFCGMCFSSDTHLNKHNYIHLGIKRFTCDICGKAFTLKCNMKEHIGIHTKTLLSET